MSLGPDAVVWAFDGRDGRAGGLGAMIGFYLKHLETLLPPPSDDPFEQIVADLSDDPTNRMLSNPRLARLFPAAISDVREADEFWRDSVHGQTRARMAAANAVASEVECFDGLVPVCQASADDWVKTLGALRLFWYAEVAGPERLAEPDPEALAANPGLGDLIDWLGYLLEDLLETRAAVLAEGIGLDPEQFIRTRRS